MKIGIALGSGAARGWSHFGVVRGLRELGIRPTVVAGSSVGALVGAALASDQLEPLEEWISGLGRRDVLRLLDADLSAGMIKGEKVISAIGDRIEDRDIESLEHDFVAVATDLNTGREVWIDDGPMLAAARASCGLPGIFSPVRRHGSWLVDGGIVNPVPVSACRAKGADLIIAVNLNRHLLRRRAPLDPPPPDARNAESGNGGYLDRLNSLFGGWFTNDGVAENTPGFFDVLYRTINIMQDGITRSRLAGEPPYVEISPRGTDVAFWEFHRAGELIEAGRQAVEENRHRLDELVELLDADES